jgi:hypothetical protein
MSVGNTRYGDGALQKNINGSNNTAFGICSSRDTDVSWNTSVGAYANMSNVSGISNVVVGTNAHLLNVSGSYNTALGTASLLNNKANSNTAVGSNAMEKNTSGKENVSVGVQSGYENTNGEKNVFLGSYAGFKNFDGSENIFLGNNSGNNPASNFSIGSKNSFLGANTGVANTNKKYNNSTAIGHGSIIDASNQIMMGTTNENVIIPGNAYLTNLTPTYNEQSIVSKKYVDLYVSGGIQITKPCRCATTEPIDLNAPPIKIDGIDIDQYFDASRVLVRCQDALHQTNWNYNDSTSSVNNGIYVYIFNINQFQRASDCAGNNVKGQSTLIVGGDLNKSNIFVQTNYDSTTNTAMAGTYPLEYIQFVKIQFSIGNGLEITGDTLQVKPNITNSAGNPYLTDIGILGKLSVGSDASFNSRVDISGKLNVGSDASFNSNVDISGNLYMTGNNFIQLSSNKTIDTFTNINSLGGCETLINSITQITTSGLIYKLNEITLSSIGFIYNATYLINGQYYIRNKKGTEQTFNYASFLLSKEIIIVMPDPFDKPKYFMIIQKTVSSGSQDASIESFSFLVKGSDFSSGKMYLYLQMNFTSSSDTWEAGFINTYITRLG